MKTVFNWAGIAIAASALAACGGGGGSAPVPVALVVKVNGTERAADASGQVAVAPGDQVEVVSSQPVNWSGAAASGSSITVRNPTTAGTTWAGQIVNEKAEAGSYALNGVSTADASVRTSLLLTVKAGDSRNGSYEVFASNGTRQKLALNFDVKTYEMNDPANAAVSASGSIAANASEAGTWEFVAPRGTSAVTARFRMTTDTVVGSFPFANQYTSLGRDARDTYSIKPFVASRALHTAQAALDGVYNRLGVLLSNSFYDNYRGSESNQVQILSAGTQMKTCTTVSKTIADCPAAAAKNFTITPGSAPDRWNLTDASTGVSGGTFSVANVAGENLYLEAGSSPDSPASANAQLFRIGVISRNFDDFVAHSGDTNEAWSVNTAVGQSDGTGVISIYEINKDGSITSAPPITSIRYYGYLPSGLKLGSRVEGLALARGSKILLISGISLYNYGYFQIGLID